MTQYFVDAFTDEIFKGNPAAVCVLEQWPDDALMQSVAMENNLSETAFAVREGAGFRLRWFTPKAEIDFCGHATLATAFVIHRFIDPGCPSITFHTQSGPFRVAVEEELFRLDFPSYVPRPVPVTDQMAQAMGVRPIAAFLDRDLLMILDSEEAVRTLAPDPIRMRSLDGLCVAVTARGREYDCVSRVFTPELDVFEDPVTGSTHCMIVPYWAQILGKDHITAFQASQRGGVLYARLREDRVVLSGKAVLFGICELFIH